jgi:cell division protein ZipA
MDINLHSFILVMGLLVIGFILFDGIKKIRENRKNQFTSFDTLSDDADVLNMNTQDNTDFDEQAYDELEIADDLVDGAFSSDLMQDKFEQPVEKMEEELLESFSAQDDAPQEQAHDDIEEIAQPEAQIESDVLTKEGLSQFVDDIEVATEFVDQDAKTVNKENHMTFSLNEEPEATPIVDEPVSQPEEAPQEIEPLDLSDHAVPVLMEPVELGEAMEPNPPIQQELHLPDFVQQTLHEEPIFASKDTPAEEELQDYINLNLDDTNVDLQKADPVGECLAEREAAQEVFVIHVFNEQGLGGFDLRRVFNACDMRFGEMNIFHRFEKANAQGKIQFSVANSLEPGSFNLNTLDELSTTGISLFMSLPGPDKPMEAFDAMAEVALVFARNFNANLCDDSHSDLNPQTLEHYRQRIRDFSRKQSLLQK